MEFVTPNFLKNSSLDAKRDKVSDIDSIQRSTFIHHIDNLCKILML